MPQLGLEDDDERDDAHRNQLAQNRREQLHVERPDHHPHQIDGDDARQDIGSVGALGHAVNPKHDQRHQQDVDEVNESERYETHNDNLSGAKTIEPRATPNLRRILPGRNAFSASAKITQGEWKSKRSSHFPEPQLIQTKRSGGKTTIDMPETRPVFRRFIRRGYRPGWQQ